MDVIVEGTQVLSSDTLSVVLDHPTARDILNLQTISSVHVDSSDSFISPPVTQLKLIYSMT